MCELAKRITVPVSLDFMSVSSYGKETKSSGVVKIVKDLDEPLVGKDVIVVEDIVDSGRTLSYLMEMLKDRNDDAHIYHKAEAILYMSKIQTYYMPQMGRLITRLKELIPKEDCREAQLPEDLIAYAFAQHIPLYQLVEDMRRTYSCETDEQVYSRWEEYIGHISKNVLDN